MTRRIEGSRSQDDPDAEARVGPQAWWPADDDVPMLLEPIGAVLARRAQEHGDRVALHWPEGDGVATMTFARLHETASRAAHALLEYADRGDRVAVWSANTVNWIVLEYACALSGTVLTPFNTAWADREVEHALQLTSPALLFAARDTRGVSLADRAQELVTTPVFALDHLQEMRGDEARALPDVGTGDPFLIQFTSGTTGKAKGAVLSHRAALNAGWIRSAVDGADTTDVWINPVPLHHVGGSICLVLAALSVGAGYVVMERYDPLVMLQLLEPTRATRLGGVPTMIQGLLDHPEFPRGRVRIRAVTMGGTTVPPSLVRRVEDELGANVAIAYGQSECPLVCATPFDLSPEIKATSVGTPLPHSEVKFVDPESGDVVEIDAPGELCVCSPITMDGYFDDPQATAQVFDSDGFLHTGDLGSIDASGIVRIHGRVREVIIRGGENIYPAEVEDAVLHHPDVLGAAVLGVDDEKWGQQVVAFVCLRSGTSVTPREVERAAEQRLAHYKVPRRWYVVDEFPLTASGKIRKVELAERLASGAAGAGVSD